MNLLASSGSTVANVSGDDPPCRSNRPSLRVGFESTGYLRPRAVRIVYWNHPIWSGVSVAMLGRFLQLCRDDKLTLLRAAPAVIRARQMMQTVSLKSCLQDRRDRDDGIASRLEGPNPQELRRAEWAVAAMSRILPGKDTCLVRSLATRGLLARRGFSTEIMVGFAKTDEGDLDGHAWLHSPTAQVPSSDDTDDTEFSKYTKIREFR